MKILRSKFEKEAAKFNSSIKKLQKENEELLERKDAEIALLYEEISRLTSLVDTLQSDNANLMVIDPDNTAALVVSEEQLTSVGGCFVFLFSRTCIFSRCCIRIKN